MYKISKITFAACCVFILIVAVFYYPKWKQSNTEATISWDVSGYYMYLPATFIYKDLKRFAFIDSVLAKYHPTPDFQQAFRHESGNLVMKYTMGQALLFAPYFFIAHVYAGLANYPPDGFSAPYQVCIGLGMLIYSFIGLWFLRKALLRYFQDSVVACTLIIIVFASNYLDYAAIDGAMTHNTLFMLYGIYLYRIIRFYETAAQRWAIGIGLLSGIITLVRPTEIICILIPLLWNVSTFEELKLRMARAIQLPKALIKAGIAFFTVLFIQLLYWKWSSGHWIVDGYRNEGFNWLHPQFINGLFSYKGGWFTYTPVMLLVMPGFYFLYRYFRKQFFSLFIFCFVFLYICFSWKEWWYGVSLGQRAIIQAYPVFCFPLAAFLSFTFKKRWSILLASLFIIFCTLYNLWLTHQAHRGQLFQGGAMTKAYFWKIAGRFHVPRDVQGLLDNEEQVPDSIIADSMTIYPQPTFIPQQLDSANQYSQQYLLPIPEGTAWLRAQVRINAPIKEWDIWKMPQVILSFYWKEQLIKANYVRVSRMLSDGETGSIHVDAKIPRQYDKVIVSIWNGGSHKSLSITDCHIIGYKKIYQHFAHLHLTE